MACRLSLAGLLLLAACSNDAPIGPSAGDVASADADTGGAIAEVAQAPDAGDTKDAAVDIAPVSDVLDADAASDGGGVPPAGMVLIPAGTFWMGCNSVKDSNCNSDESPQHKVTLSAYYIDLTETTVGQYKACVDAGVCTVPSSVQPDSSATYPGLTENPVNNVNWAQSQAYCKWRGSAFDLPTEAQWEMAARGSCEKNGSSASDPACAQAMRTYPWGEAMPTCSYAVMFDGSNDGCGTNATWAVGSRTAGDSPYGVHDMAGNVWEWNRDWYSPYGSSAVMDPLGSDTHIFRILRGGGFEQNDISALSADYRDHNYPNVAGAENGFRCSRAYP